METVTRQEVANALKRLKRELLEEVKTTAAAQMAETVTRQEVADALEGLKRELLEEVKTTAAAQMAQTLSESGLEGMSSEQLARLGLLAEHGPGICSDDHCSHCEKDRLRFRQEGEALASKAKRTLFAELAQAAQAPRDAIPDTSRIRRFDGLYALARII